MRPAAGVAAAVALVMVPAAAAKPKVAQSDPVSSWTDVLAPELKDAGVLYAQASFPHELWINGIQVGAGDASTTFRVILRPGRHEVAAEGKVPMDAVEIEIVEGRASFAAVRARSGDGDGAQSGPKADVAPPRAIERTEPLYPLVARQKGIEGTVVLQCIVVEDGSVLVAGILESIPYLDEAAFAAVRSWRYEPARRGGKPIAVHVAVRVKFSLPT